MNDVRNELGLSGAISLGQNEVRSLAGINNGRISMNDLKGKSSAPWFKDIVDYYFETIEDFHNRIDQISIENKKDLINKTFGFSDKVTSLEGAFGFRYIKESIISTPKAIYGNYITDFSRCFSIVTLSKISPDLFRNSPNAADFCKCFQHCRNIVEIPNKLFYNVGINFSCCFEYCWSLQKIPSDLFFNNKNDINFHSCFKDCNELSIVPFNLFDDCPNAIKFSECFNYCTNITSALPDVWNKSKFPNVTYYSDYAGGCTKAANYNEIPEGWK